MTPETSAAPWYTHDLIMLLSGLALGLTIGAIVIGVTSGSLWGSVGLAWSASLLLFMVSHMERRYHQ